MPQGTAPMILPLDKHALSRDFYLGTRLRLSTVSSPLAECSSRPEPPVQIAGPQSPAGKRVALFPVRNSRLMRLAWRPLGAAISILLRFEPARDGWRGTTPPIACPLH